MQDKSIRRKRKLFYGWWMVAAAVVMHFFGGGTFYYGFTVFFNPIRNNFGWTAAITSVAFSLQRLEFGILGPLAGFLVDRIGPRKMMFAGWSVVGLGFLLMSRINSLWAFYAAFMVIAMGFSFASGTVINTAIANWFNRKRSRAIALTFMGPGLSGILVPILALAVSQFGWRETLTIASFVLWGVGVPLSLVMRHKPAQYGYLPDGDIPLIETDSPSSSESGISQETKQLDSTSSPADVSVKNALKNRPFWLLAAVFFFQQLAQSSVMVHIVPYLESVGIPGTIAAIAVTGMTLASLIGRLSFGFLGDFRDKRYLIAIALSLQAVGLFVFSFIEAGNIWLILLFLITYAPGYGGPIPLRPALQADYFGTKNFGTILGLIATVGMFGGLISPVFTGWVYDITGNYYLVWRLFALLLLPSIPLMLLAKPPGKNKL
ncbi:MFS transporter [Chloroflexota bacterium]